MHLQPLSAPQGPWHAAIPWLPKRWKGRATTVSISSELENELIHYSHGRGLTGADRANAPRSHRVRQPQDYRKTFGDQNAENVRAVLQRPV